MSRLPEKNEQDHARRFRYHYAYVIVITGILTVTGALGLARFGYATILPSMKLSLMLNNTQMGAIATGNLVGYTAFSLIGGFLAARYGPRFVIGISMLVAGSTMFLTGLVNGFTTAVVFRFLTGLGSAGSNVPVMGLVSAWFAPRRRGMAAGFLVGGSGVGFVLTGFLIPNIITNWPQNGWRLSWFILGGLVVGLGIISFLLLRNNPSEKGLTPVGADPETANHTTGVIVAGPEETAAINRAASGPLQSRSSAGAAGPEGATGITPAASPEEYAGRPSWGNVYGSPALWHLGLVYLFFGFSYIIYGTFFSAAMISDKGLTQAQAGLIWSMIGGIGIFSGILWGTISDYLGRKYAMAIVFSLQAACYLLFAVAGTTGMLYVSAILYGLTAFSIPGIVAAACGDYVGPRLAPAALGMVTLFFAVGQATAPSVAGYLTDVTNSFSKAFLLASAVAALGGAVSLTLRPPKERT